MNELKATSPTLMMRRTFAAPRDRVFAAWTDPQIMRRWFGPGEMRVDALDFQAHVGAAYRLAMVSPDGESYVVRGTVRELRAPERLVMTWQWEGDDGDLEGAETLLSLDFHDRGNETELVLMQENFVDAASRDRHEEGWTAVLDKLSAALDAR
jgi:uncharacterized protein YndB with AHSA1/START domain